MKETAKYLSSNTQFWVINDKLLNQVEQEIQQIEKRISNSADRAVQIRKKNGILAVLRCLKNYIMDPRIQTSTENFKST